MSCSERNKGWTIWLGHDDADEIFYFYNLSSNDADEKITLKDVMKEYSTVQNIENIGRLRCDNLLMERSKNDETYRDSVRTSYERTKEIIIPENVNFYYFNTV